MEQNFTEIVQSLQDENKKLRQHLTNNLKESAARRVIEKYKLSRDYEPYLDLAILRTQADLSDTVETLAEKMEASMMEACEKNGVEPPKTPSDFMTSYIEKMRAQEADNLAYGESLTFAGQQ
jgi:hypothetical protein